MPIFKFNFLIFLFCFIITSTVYSKKKDEKKINLSVKDAEIQDVLSFLAKEAGLNILLTDEVKGKITIYFENVSLKNAMNTIMKTLNLSALKEDNILIIMPTDTYIKILEKEKEIKEKKYELQTFAPIIVK